MSQEQPSRSGYTTPVSRFYIDVRSYIPPGRNDTVKLPLLKTLSSEQQDKIKAFMRPADRLMSLASALLKYVFIHRYALIPWDEVRISRTPDPHRRPYWEPGAGSTGGHGLEFNVSHQNGMVILIGCKTPDEQSQAYSTPRDDDAPVPERTQEQVRLGVDLACANEHGRTPADITSQEKLDEWVDIFEEMFSESCRNDMKTAPIRNSTSLVHTVQQRFRRFYAFWALKEAFIKMVGEGLLADWLSKLEFDGVHAPDPPISDDFSDDGFSWALRDEHEFKWTPPTKAEKNIKAILHGKRLNDVKLSLVAFEDDFLCATAMRGVIDASEGTAQERWMLLDIDNDIRPCAEGKCKCLEQRVIDGSAPLTATGSVTTVGSAPYHIVSADMPK